MDAERSESQRRTEPHPSHGRYKCMNARVRSFVKYDWSPQTVQTPRQLAEAGFFYTGYGDATLCFHCGCGLKRWLKKDDPFEEHAKHSPKCHYLQLIKGEGFIREVQMRKFPNDFMRAAPFRSRVPEVDQTIVEGKECIANDTMRAAPYQPRVPEVDQTIVEGKECLICLTLERQIAFQPCGHLATCIHCSFKINICCICRIEIKSRMRIIQS